MSNRFTRLMAVGLCSLALAVVAVPASAQGVFTGRIDIEVQDATGAVLPGVMVDLTGPRNAMQVTDALGEAHFLNLPPGTYQVKASLQGFTEYQNQNVIVVTGVSVPLRIALKVAGVQEQVIVEAESPIIDTKKQTTATNVTVDELQNIPTSRDPWVVLQTVPSVLVDRVNVGGAESGQQSIYMAKGATDDENTWNMDGIPITDMGAVGSSPTYYDFDMFQEMQITTGGAELTNPTPGVQLNFVLRSGTNTPHGSARGFFSKDEWQSKNLSAELAEAIGGTTKKGNRTDQYADYGFELGGPLVRDKWWAWGALGKTDVRVRTLINTLDRTILDNASFKSQAQLTDTFRASYTFFRGDKKKFGRGASPTRPDETTWDQSGPTPINKVEGNLTVGNSLFLTGRYGHIGGGFQLVPKGGMTTSVYQDDEGVYHGSYVFYKSDRPQHTALAEGNWFRGRHEVKFGFSWRRTVVESLSQWPGTKQLNIHIGYPLMVPIFFPDEVRNNTGRYTNAYLGDTISLDRLTISLGIRFDRQTSSLDVASRVAHPVIPEVLPALTTPAKDNTHDFKAVTPRVGMTYALDENRKTLLRASYAMFAGQLGATESGFVAGPIYYSYIYYLAIDSNRNNITDRDEILFNIGPLGWYGFDPERPNSTESVNRVGADLKVPKTHEVLLGVDRELMPNFGVSGTFSWRRFNGVRWSPLIGVRSDDYVEAGRVTGNQSPIGSFDVPYYKPRPGVLPPGNGREDVNREGYYQRYWGFEVSATKRMSNRWMARLGFSTNDHREYFTDPNLSIEDPTPTPDGPLKDGGLVIVRSVGSGKTDFFFLPAKYQFIATGLFQGPWGINAGVNLLSRQGFGKPYNRGDVVVDDPAYPLKDVLLVGDIADFRLPTVTELDLRFEKAFTFGRTNVMFDVDVFNVANSSTELKRQYDLRRTGRTGFDKILEIMNPRILRLGLRFNF